MTNSKKFLFAACLTSLITGALFFCTYQEWLIVYWNRPSEISLHAIDVQKKHLTLYRLTNGSLTTESVELLSNSEQQDMMTHITIAWLNWLANEGFLDKKIQVQSLLLSPSGYESYLSLNQSPFEKTWSIKQKEELLESLLKTWHENGCTASLVYFLVDHKPLQDAHLDFSEGWALRT